MATSIVTVQELLVADEFVGEAFASPFGRFSLPLLKLKLGLDSAGFHTHWVTLAQLDQLGWNVMQCSQQTLDGDIVLFADLAAKRVLGRRSIVRF